MRRILLFLTLLSLLAPSGCRRIGDDVVATVGTIEVPISAFQNYLTELSGQQWEVVDSRVASTLLDQYLEEESLFFAAGHDAPQIPRNPAERSARLRQLILKTCGPAPTPSPDSIEAALRKKIAVGEPERVLIRQLLLPDEASALKARKQLAEGADFEKLSAEISIAPNAGRGGALGWVPRGSQPEEIEDVIFSLKAGEISSPVRGPGGYHLFQLLDRREAGPARTEELRPGVIRELTTASERSHIRSCIDTAAKRAGIVVYPKHLWFEYSGKFKEDFDEN